MESASVAHDHHHATDESKEVGWKGPDGKGAGESVGHKEGKRIVEILRATKAEVPHASAA